MSREARSPQRPGDGLADRGVDGLAGPGAVELPPGPVRPVVERLRRALGAVVALHDRGQPAASLAGAAERARGLTLGGSAPA